MLGNELVLVTGATGAIGPAVVQALQEAGYAVRVLCRDNPNPSLSPADIDVRVGDITDQPIVDIAMQGVAIVIHMAALLHVDNPPVALRQEFERVNVQGTKTVVQAARKAGVRRLVFSSTVGVYGYHGSQILTEDTPARPMTIYAQTKFDAEEIVLAATQSDGNPLSTVLRFGAVYGGRVKGNYRRLANALARGCFMPVGDGSNRRSLIFDRDVAQAVALAAQHPAAAGRIYNVTDGQLHTLTEIVAAICTALGRTLPRAALPKQPIRIAAGLLEDAAKLVGRTSPIGRATIDKYTEEVVVDARRIQAELGFKPRYDLKTGWRETIGEMRRNGEV